MPHILSTQRKLYDIESSQQTPSCFSPKNGEIGVILGRNWCYIRVMLGGGGVGAGKNLCRNMSWSLDVDSREHNYERYTLIVGSLSDTALAKVVAPEWFPCRSFPLHGDDFCISIQLSLGRFRLVGVLEPIFYTPHIHQRLEGVEESVKKNPSKVLGSQRFSHEC